MLYVKHVIIDLIILKKITFLNVFVNIFGKCLTERNGRGWYKQNYHGKILKMWQGQFFYLHTLKIKKHINISYQKVTKIKKCLFGNCLSNRNPWTDLPQVLIECKSKRMFFAWFNHFKLIWLTSKVQVSFYSEHNFDLPQNLVGV